LADGEWQTPPADCQEGAGGAERDGEDNVATGWHAIELLLWGQDPQRYRARQPQLRGLVDRKRPNADRRRVVLSTMTELPIDDERTAQQIARLVQAAEAIPAPLDRAIAVGSPCRARIQATIASFMKRSRDIVRAAAAIGITRLALAQP
jgi:uncharacterized iron-regulated protein